MFHSTKLYTVHIKPAAAHASERPVFVREGFNLYAFLFTAFWALYERLWWPAVGILAANALVMKMQAIHWLSQPGAMVVMLAIQFFVAFTGNDWKRKRLSKQGYVVADMSAGDSLLRAEQRYFERLLAAH